MISQFNKEIDVDDTKIFVVDENNTPTKEIKEDGSEEKVENNDEKNDSIEKNKTSISDNAPMDYDVEMRGEFQIGYYHSNPFWGKTKLGISNFGKITVSGNNGIYEVSKVKVNKKKHLIQILGLQGADKATIKAVKKATKGANGLSFTVNPYYVKDSDAVTTKIKKDGTVKYVIIKIFKKGYKAKKDEYEYDSTLKKIVFKGQNLAGSFIY